jgi:hypothetical protein
VLTKKIRKDDDDDDENNNTNKEGKLLWYHQGVEYWNHVDATVDGVLGGFGSVSGADAKENERILRTMMYPEEEFSEILEKRALDVGAGVGRVSVRDFVCVIVFSFRRRVQVLVPFVCAYISSSRLTFSLLRLTRTEHVLDEVLPFGRFAGTGASLHRKSQGDVEG